MKTFRNKNTSFNPEVLLFGKTQKTKKNVDGKRLSVGVTSQNEL